MLAWPTDLPRRVKKDGYRRALADGRRSVQTDSDIPIVAPRYSVAGEPFAAEIEVKTDLFARLMRFWNEETKRGALPFLMRDQVLDGAAFIDEDGNTIVDENDNIVTLSEVRVTIFDPAQGSPQTSALGGGYLRIGFSLLALPG